jgi:hypothetical protein
MACARGPALPFSLVLVDLRVHRARIYIDFYLLFRVPLHIL